MALLAANASSTGPSHGPKDWDYSVLQNLLKMGGGLEGGNHRKRPGVQKPSRGLRTFKTASYELDTAYVATNRPSVPSV
jgi:hypothetical protein